MDYGTIKLHFSSAQKAQAASVDNSATAGERAASGRIKTWIGKVAKATPTETAAQAAERIRSASK